MSIHPKKLAINYNPPILILQYEKSQQLRNLKLFMTDVFEQELHDSHDEDDIMQKIAGKLYSQQREFFRSVPSRGLHEMIGKLLRRYIAERHRGSVVEEELASVPSNIDLTNMEQIKQIDLNKLDEDALEQAKLTMDVDFEMNRLRPGDPGYKHDVEADFGEAVEDSGWDSD